MVDDELGGSLSQGGSVLLMFLVTAAFLLIRVVKADTEKVVSHLVSFAFLLGSYNAVKSLAESGMKLSMALFSLAFFAIAAGFIKRS